MRRLWVDVLEVAWVAILSTCVSRTPATQGGDMEILAEDSTTAVPVQPAIASAVLG